MNVFCIYDQFGKVIQLMSTTLDEIPVADGYFLMLVDPEQPDFVFDAESYFVSETGDFLKKPNRPSVFHVWENRQWAFNRPGLIDEVIGAANSRRSKNFFLPVTYEGVVFDADQVAIGNIQSTLLVFQALKQLPEGFAWRSHDNQLVSMTYEKLEGLAQTIYARNAQVYAESWALKDSLESKTDEELLVLYEQLS